MSEQLNNNVFSENIENQEKNKVNTKENTNKEILEKRPDEWMVRPCEMYKEEYKDCTCMKARFNQYFIFGEMTDCSQWKQDFENCKKWTNDNDDAAYNEIIASETARRIKRFKAHYANNVWKKRDKPPKDWNKPLPDWLEEKFENSYLDLKNRQMKSGEVNDFDTKIPCTIL